MAAAGEKNGAVSLKLPDEKHCVIYHDRLRTNAMGNSKEGGV
jgi:hypothetical protein